MDGTVICNCECQFFPTHHRHRPWLNCRVVFLSLNQQALLVYVNSPNLKVNYSLAVNLYGLHSNSQFFRMCNLETWEQETYKLYFLKLVPESKLWDFKIKIDIKSVQNTPTALWATGCFCSYSKILERSAVY